jgi:hypothetical protein
MERSSLTAAIVYQKGFTHMELNEAIEEFLSAKGATLVAKAVRGYRFYLEDFER